MRRRPVAPSAFCPPPGTSGQPGRGPQAQPQCGPCSAELCRLALVLQRAFPPFLFMLVVGGDARWGNNMREPPLFRAGICYARPDAASPHAASPCRPQTGTHSYVHSFRGVTTVGYTRPCPYGCKSAKQSNLDTVQSHKTHAWPWARPRTRIPFAFRMVLDYCYTYSIIV
jgi:hypothetical protein